MKKIYLVTICCLYFFSATGQAGVNQNTLENVREEAEKRKKDLNENFNIPEYKPPKEIVYKPVKIDEIDNESLAKPKANKTSSITQDFNSKDPAVVEAALERIRQKAKNNPMSRGVGLDNMVKYQEGQEAFNGSYYGFNPYISVEENKKFYAKMGFTISYKYSDAKIYTFIFGGIAFLTILGGGLYFWNKRLRWKEL